MPESGAKAVFLSYSRDDAASARRIAEALRASGVEVWFDENELRGGDAWDAKIRRQIGECSLFLPLISRNTEARNKGYFRLEWKLAVDQTYLHAAGVPFLAPVVIDDMPEKGTVVPAEFLRVQWMRLPGALPTPDFVAQIQRLLAAPVAGSDAKAAAAPLLATSPVPPGRRPSAIAACAAALVIVAAGFGWFWLKRPGTQEEPATPAAQLEARSPATVDGKSIAVLPFTNMSEDKDTGFFADGVHEDLLTTLALVPELKVVSRTSVLQYRGTTKTIRQIGQELGVAYVLEGSVRRSGNKVRVTGQLINSRSDEHVWAKNYDRDLTDVFSIQTALSQEIAAALSAAISPQTRQLLDRRPTQSAQAYDFYLRGRDVRNRSPSGAAAPVREAAAFFKSAVTEDPTFAAAWGELADAYALQAFWEIDASAENLARGDAAIAKAVSLSPRDPEVMRSQGTYAYYAYRDYARATAVYEQIARLQPNDPTVFESIGLIQRRQGRDAEALINLRRAAELDPANVSYIRSIIQSLGHARRNDGELLALLKRKVELMPGQLHEEWALAETVAAMTGSLQEEEAFLAKLSAEERESPRGLWYRKQAAYDRADWSEFLRLDRIQPEFDEEVEPAYDALSAAAVYWKNGDPAGVAARLGEFPGRFRAQIKQEPSNPKLYSILAGMEALLGHAGEGERLAQKAMEMMPSSRDAIDAPNYVYASAWVAAAAGDDRRAIQVLTRLLQAPSSFTVFSINNDAIFWKLHGNPEYEAMLKDPKCRGPLF
jgi:TolB-like protein/Tfp pilus assembly protein PilF